MRIMGMRNVVQAATARVLQPGPFALRPLQRFSASSPNARDSSADALFASLLAGHTESSNKLQREFGGLQVKVDHLKEMSVTQTACEKASTESIKKLISDGLTDQKASAARLEAEQKASAASLEQQIVDSADTLRKQISKGHLGLSDEMFEMRDQLFQARNDRFQIQESVSDIATFTRSAFFSALVPVVLVCGLGGPIAVTGMSTGYIVPEAISLDIAKHLAKGFSGLATTGFAVAGITFSMTKYFAKADKQARARHQKDKEEFYQERNLFHIKQEAYRKETEKRPGDK